MNIPYAPLDFPRSIVYNGSSESERFLLESISEYTKKQEENEMKNIFKKTLSLIIVSMMVMTLLPAGIAIAETTHDMSTPGTLTIAASGGDYVITGTTAADKIVIAPNYIGTITLQGTSISAAGHPIEVGADAEVTFVLDGANALTSTATGANYASAIKINAGAEVIIKAITPGNDASGSLTANGGGVGAGINVMKDSALTIESGTIVANASGAGSSDGYTPASAGIGGAAMSGGYGSITINGGYVTAKGGTTTTASGGGGAGIGNSGIGWRVAPGTNLNFGDITINGGTIIATGGTGNTSGGSGAGIGMGGTNEIYPIGNMGICTGRIIINGGNVTATGGNGGNRTAAGIGGGSANDGQDLLLPDIIITGGTVTATAGAGAGSGSAGIGTGGSRNATINNIIITGGTVKATGSFTGAGIGTGWSGGNTNPQTGGGGANPNNGMVKNIILLGGDITARSGPGGNVNDRAPAIGQGSYNTAETGNNSINIVIGTTVKIVDLAATRDIGGRKTNVAGSINQTINSIILLPGANISYVEASDGITPKAGTPKFGAANAIFSLTETANTNIGVQDTLPAGATISTLNVATDTGTASAKTDFSGYTGLAAIDAILTGHSLDAVFSSLALGLVDDTGTDYNFTTQMVPTADVEFSAVGYTSDTKLIAEMSTSPINVLLTSTSTPPVTTQARVVFDYNGGIDGSGKRFSEVSGDAGDPYTIPTINKTGYTHTGWAATTPSGTFGAADTVETYTAQWTAIPYTVTFTTSADGAISGTATATIDYDAAVASIPATATPNAGYYFTGWKLGTGIYDAEAVKAYIVKGNITFEAQYAREEKATVIFDYAGGTDGTRGYALMSEYPGTALTPPPNPTKTGYDFAAWSAVPAATFGAAGSTTTYTATWTIKTYTVNFAAGTNGAIAPAAHSETTVHGANVSTVPTVTPNTGYVFSGWELNSTGKIYSSDAVEAYAVTAATTFTATYTDAENATVIFDYNGGDILGVSSSHVNGKAGAAYSVPTGMSKTGYTFNGWNIDPIPTTFGAAGSITTYTAQWKIKEYTVTFDKGAHGTMIPAVFTQQVNHGGTVTSPIPTLTADSGYTFQGWCLDATGDIYSDDAAAAYVVTGDSDFIAMYDEMPATVVFDYNGGAVSGASSSTLSGKAGTAYTTPVPTNTGYTLAWSTAPTEIFGAPGSVTIYTAVWTPIPYSVTFAAGANGTISGTTTATVNYDASVTSIPATVTANTGWVFVGWELGTTGNIYSTDAVKEYVVKSSVTFTAVFARSDKATIIFDYAGGTDGNGAYIVLQDYPGETPAIPTGISKTGYTFDGWDTTVAVFGAVGTTAIYTAKWIPVSYTVTFSEGAHGIMTPNPAAEVVNHGAAVTSVPVISPFSYWSFLGWSANGSSTYYSSDDVLAMPITGDTAFEAQYKATVINNVSTGSAGSPYSTARLIVKGIDSGTGNEIYNQSVTTIVGKTETVKAPEIKGYELIDGAADTETIAIKRGDNEVVFRYKSTTATQAPPTPPVPTSTPTPDASGWKNVFTDVKSGEWFYEAVKYVNENGLMNGTSGTAFAPDMNITRGMLVTMLYRAEGEPKSAATNPFTDIAGGQWYTEAVVWAAENGVVNGYGDGTFGPNDNITREQFALILYSYAKWKDIDVSASADLLSFSDAEAVSDWAKTAMQWAAASGLIQGRGANMLAPTGNATRAEAAMLMMRFIEGVLK